MRETRGAGGRVVRCKPGVGEAGAGGVERVWDQSWGGGGRVGGQRGWGSLCTTSGSSVCGQGGCQALGLWIAGDCLRGVWGEAEE